MDLRHTVNTNSVTKTVKNNSTNSTLPRRTRRMAALLCAALAGLGLARGAAAQNIPQAGSPGIPTPYQSPFFHAGGSDPVLDLTPPFLNPLYGQLQGTPTETVGGTATTPGFPVQIPSFNLGAYAPSQGPSQGPGLYFPSHLADGGIYSWAAPFNYVPLAAGQIQVDDVFPAPTTVPAAGASGFALTVNAGNWTQQATGPAAGTATGGEYLRLGQGLDGTAVWTLSATTAGSFSIYYHIPDQVEDANGVVEPRSTQVTYQITTSVPNSPPVTATVSQTEANSSQFLAGPFLLAVGQSVTVTLQRDPTHNRNTNNDRDGNGNVVQDYLIADSMTLQTAIGDVRSAPTAINYTSFPADFAKAKYWGIFNTPGTNNAQAVAGTALTANALPDYGPANSNPPSGPPNAGAKPFIFYGDPTAKQPDGTTVDGLRRIRQLVYFGRQDPTFSNGVTVDDRDAAFTATGFQRNVADTTSTSTNNEYSTATPVSNGVAPGATWTFSAPNGGGYYVTVHLPATQGTLLRIPDATYSITVNGVALANQPLPANGFQISQAQTGDVTLPTGAIPLNKGDTVAITLKAATAQNNANKYQVVADSVRIATSGNGTGAIYCVDGFNGNIVWRFETPGGLNGPSAAVFSSPVITKINVMVKPPTAATPAVYLNKLVVIVGDENGMVYCLDAIGNGDGTSNANAIDPISGLPIYLPQPGYQTAPVQVDAAGYTPHVGTTGAYWIYRPDPNKPKIVTGAGIGTVRRNGSDVILDPNNDLPVPAAFGTASPNVFVDPNINTLADATGSIPLNADGTAPSNAKVYVGNSNGVLYALDAVGVPIDPTSVTTFENTGDRFNGSYDLPRATGELPIPTPQPLWWFTLRGADPNSTTNTSSADIESAPAIFLTRKVTSTTGGSGTGSTNTYSYAPTVYIGSAHEMEATSNIGRVYALDGLLGPSGNNGTSFPSKQPDPTAANYTGPGSSNYNIGQRPQTSVTDTFDWSFPDAYDTTKGGRNTSSNKLPRPALGNITGSPVVFTDAPHQSATAPTRTRIYFAANSGLEVPYTAAAGTVASARPDETETGRIWAVNLDGTGVPVSGSAVWSYPLANDPNNAALDRTPEPGPPIGAFLRATPAMGFVQFPTTIQYADGTAYTHGDSVAGDVKGGFVPMLYVATRGVNDTALYAVDVHGTDDASNLIYRQISPDGSIFQSSPALITNTSTSGGNGGAIYVVGGNTLYDFSATPISNPITGQEFPLIRENKAYTGFGPISSPALSSADTYDLFTTPPGTGVPVGYTYPTNTTDWIYVGDSGTGFCRGITPYDLTDTGIPIALGSIVPANPDAPGAVDLQAIMQVYLVNDDPASASSTSAAIPPALKVGAGAPLPVYDWGQSVYIRFKNVVPPADAKGNPVYVMDSGNTTTPSPANPVQVYGNGGPIEFDLSDTTIDTPTTATGAAAAAATLTAADHGTVPAVLLTTTNTPLNNGFYQRGDPVTNADGVLVNVPTTANPSKAGYIGAYTYAISDGTARRNTPGARRHITNAKQTVTVYNYDGQNFTKTGTAVIAVQTTNGNEIPKPIYGANGVITGYQPQQTIVQPVDEPVFGILNPLAIRAGGIPLPLTPTTKTYAVPIADELGPFRAVTSPLVTGNDKLDLEALSNGNDVLVTPPDSTSGGGGIDPTKRNLALTNPPTSPHVVVTSTSLVPHNSSGDNSDVTGQALSPMGFGVNNDGLNGAEYFGRLNAPFAMDIADRSALGERLNRLRVKTGTVSGGGAGLYWNDNSPYNSGLPNAIATPGHDHDSVVNYLPWETTPPAGRYENGSINSSIDYPNIGTSDVTATLYPYLGGSADLTLGNAVAKPATLNGTEPSGRQVYTNPVQFHVSIPHYQPANQQLYISSGQTNALGLSNYNGLGEIPPTSLTSNANYTFPMGYVTTRRIYIPDQTGFYRPGAAYRDVRIYTGVPPDYSTQMGDSTVDVGSVPSGFGIQTSKFAALSDSVNNTTTFDPFNLAFQDYYKPLKIYNTGNVNLLNVHLDQKQSTPTNAQQALSLVSDALDVTSFIPGYDYNAVTGPRSGTFGNVPEEPYLIRSSLDSDLVAAFGHNPAIATGTNAAGTSLISIYPGATFHKAQVGSGQPTTLYVPDSPEGYTPGATLDVPTTNHPTHVTDGNNGNLPFKTAPFVSVAAPFGMPVGSYHGAIQLFEGLDAGGYPKVVTTIPANLQGYYTGLTAQIYPPQYGSAIGGIGTPNYSAQPNGLPQDTIQIGSNGGSPVSLMPNSSNTAVLNVKVLEDRMTDGLTYGSVSQIDQGPAIPATNNTAAKPVPDFAPAAYRDPNTRNLSLYWTSGRGAGTSASAQFNIYQALVPYVKDTNGNFAFLPVDPTAPTTYVPQWWTSLGSESAGYNSNGTLIPVLAANAGTNSGLTIAQDSLNLSSIAAFSVNVQSPPLTASYQNTLLYYPVTAGTGALGSAVPITNDPTQVKYGVKGLFTDNAFANTTPNLWAFWTATTRGRSAIYYNSQAPGGTSWIPATGPSTTGLLPIPAGLTGVADAAPMLTFGNVLTANGYQGEETIEVTYSGTAPDGRVNLYQSRYQPDGTPGNPKPYQLDLVPYPAVTEILAATGQADGWYQARDAAWSRTSQFNMFVNGTAILYDTANNNAPLFSRAVFDKASGLLVLTGVKNQTINSAGTLAFPAIAANGTVTAYVDLATGRVRFTSAPHTTATLTALFSPLARRITYTPGPGASQADTGPVTFLDGSPKPNDAPGQNSIRADRRWYIWRKSGASGAALPASIYYKTQRLTLFLPSPIGYSIPATAGGASTLLLNSVTINGTDVTKYVDVDYARGRIYFPINTNGTYPEGMTATATYAPANTVTTGNPNGTVSPPVSDTIQWQDEEHTSSGTVSPISTANGLNSPADTLLPIAGPVNENNVAAFLDPFAGLNTEHKVWLFWNSTRNGTADLYYETINPLFTAL